MWHEWNPIAVPMSLFLCLTSEWLRAWDQWRCPAWLFPNDWLRLALNDSRMWLHARGIRVRILYKRRSWGGLLVRASDSRSEWRFRARVRFPLVCSITAVIIYRCYPVTPSRQQRKYALGASDPLAMGLNYKKKRVQYVWFMHCVECLCANACIKPHWHFEQVRQSER